jgi:hypothetical protein
MTDFIDAAGHSLWVPIPLDRDSETVHAELLARFGADDPTADHAALIAGVARQLTEGNDVVEQDGVQNLAAWALLQRPEELVVRALATLRVVLLETEVAAEEVVRELSGAETLFEAPALRPVDTRSGEAVSVRLRPMVEEAGASRVHEVSAVLWSRAEQSAWYLLSTYSTDLVEAGEVHALLEELAAGLEGL